MPLRSCSHLPAIAAIAAVTLGLAGPARADEKTVSFWTAYQGLEERALDDYQNAVTAIEVIENGRQLKALSRSTEFATLHPSCGRAAETLSYMVTSHYYSRRRLAIPADWHAFSDQYAEQRRTCLSDLKLDIGKYALPSWFGK